LKPADHVRWAQMLSYWRMNWLSSFFLEKRFRLSALEPFAGEWMQCVVYRWTHVSARLVPVR